MDIQTKIRLEKIFYLVGETKNKIVLDLGSKVMDITKKIKAKKRITLDAVANSEVSISCDLNKDKIPLEDSSVDVIIAGELIEHIRSTLFFLKECNRVLKKGGIFVLSTPNSVSLIDRFKVLFGRLPLNCAKYTSEEKDKYNSHVRDFNLSLLTKALTETGFIVEKKETNGIISHSKLLFPLKLTPVTLGQNFIIKAIKK